MLEGYSGLIRSLQERDIVREDNCFGGAAGTVDCFGGALEKLQARLIDWEELQASSVFVSIRVYHLRS